MTATDTVRSSLSQKQEVKQKAVYAADPGVRLDAARLGKSWPIVQQSNERCGCGMWYPLLLSLRSEDEMMDE